MRKLIINADDFGLSEGANKGIIKSFKEGLLTSTTLMANGSAFKEAVKLAKENPDLGIGIHLTLTGGKSVLSPEEIPSLVSDRGYFPAKYTQLLCRIALRKIRLKEIEKELRAQFERIKRTGLEITHFDSHRHIHLYPEIFKITVRLARAYDISCLRYPVERFSFKSFFTNQYFKTLFLSTMACLNKKVLLKNKMLTTDHFVGMLQAGNLTEEIFKDILSSLPQGTSEVMCNPAYVDEEIKRSSFYLIYQREKEIDVLTSFTLKKLVKNSDIQLISYRDLRS